MYPVIPIWALVLGRYGREILIVLAIVAAVIVAGYFLR